MGNNSTSQFFSLALDKAHDRIHFFKRAIGLMIFVDLVTKLSKHKVFHYVTILCHNTQYCVPLERKQHALVLLAGG